MNNHVFYRSPIKEYPIITHGRGVYLYDENGNSYLDACSGSLVANIGHGVDEIADAMAEQARTLAFVHGSRWASKPLTELAARVVSLTPGDLNRVYFVNSGSEASEAAAKMARQFFVERDGDESPKHKIMGRWFGFHGVTIGTLAFGGNILRRRPFLPMLSEQPHAPPCYCYRCPYGLSYPSCHVKCATDIEEQFLREGPESIAAFIAEPIVGATLSAVPAVDEYFSIIRELCVKYDILLIADEVMTGFGRTGRNFGIDHYDVVPDLMVMAKGMGAGYAPIAAVATNEKIWNAFREGSGQFVHGHTYGGNPLSAATACAVLKYVERHNLIDRAAQLESTFFEEVGRLRRHPIVGDIRGKGLMVGVEFVRDTQSREPFDKSIRVADKVTEAGLRHGVIVYPGQGSLHDGSGDHILLGPPLTVSRDELTEIASRLDAAVSEVATQLEETIV